MNVLLRCTLAFIAGILLKNAEWGHLLGHYGYWIFVITTGCLFLLLFWFVSFSKTSRYFLGSSVLLLFLGLGWILAPNHTLGADIGEVAAYEATVLAPPETRAKTYKVEVAISKGKNQNGWKPLKGKVLLYIDKAAPKPHYGDVLLIRGVSKLVEHPQNPDQFDYKWFLAQKGIYHQQYLKATDFIVTGKKQVNFLKEWAYTVSEWSDTALRRLVKYDREYTVAKAMVLGLRDEMDNDLVQAYSAAGAVHVLSVSGFHITIFIGILAFLLGHLEKSKHGKWLYLSITLITMWFYAVLTGLSAPVIRSALMFSLFLLAKPLGRKSNGVNALFGSALILLVLDPMLIYSVSFQLSYAALSGIIFLQPILYQSLTFKDWFMDKVWAITAVAITAQLATFPIGAYYFHQFPTYFWLVNPLVVALSCAMLPVALATIALAWVPLLSDALGWALTGITWLLNQVVVWTQQLPYSVLGSLSLSGAELWVIYAMMGLLIALFYYRDWRWLWSIGALSVVLLGIQLIEIQQSINQKQLIFHAVPHQTVITLMTGTQVFLVADSAFFQPDKKPYNFYLGNFYTKRSISRITQESLQSPSPLLNLVKTLPFGKLIVWEGQKILLVEKPIENSIPPLADYVLIRYSAFRSSEKLLAIFGKQKLIFDNSNKFYVLDTLQKQAQAAQLPWYFVHQKGAWMAQIQKN